MSIEMQHCDASSPRVWDAIVLGAGVAGLTAAHELNLRGRSVLVIEASTQCGGTHRSHEIGPYTFDVGSVFFTPGHPFFEVFPGLREMCPEIRRIQRRVAPDGDVHHYPFALSETLRWPLGAKLSSALDLAYRRLAPAATNNVEELCVSRIGKVAYQKLGLQSYIQRFNSVPPSEIDPSFFEKRMGHVLSRTRLTNLGRSATGLLAAKKEKPHPGGRLLVRPQEGFHVMYDKVRKDLEDRGVVFMMQSPVQRLTREGAQLAVTLPNQTLRSPVVVGAIPLDTMHRAAFGTDTGLESINLMTLFASVDSLADHVGNVFFNFHTKGRWKRMTIYSRIYGLADGREYFAVEIPYHGAETLEPEREIRALSDHMKDLDLITSDLRLEGHDIVDAAYPLLRVGCIDKSRAAADRLQAFGITPVGRQGRFDYLPISGQVIAKTRDSLVEAGLTEASKTEA